MERQNIRVDLHQHSSFSDGISLPAAVAAGCARSGVSYASLTDHDTVAGLDDFESACAQYGVGFVAGVELTVPHDGAELHLLGYGFDRADADLSALIEECRQRRTPGVPSLYQQRSPRSLAEVIRTFHRAGGTVFWAHPFSPERSPVLVGELLSTLTVAGMDGVELYHHSADEEQRTFLRAAASRLGLLFSGGSDHHGAVGPGTDRCGVEMPVQEWRRFRDSLFSRRRGVYRTEEKEPLQRPAGTAPVQVSWRRLIAWMVLPALVAVALVLVALFGFFLPGYERELLERKRETIKELTATVLSMLGDAESRVRSGAIAPDEARRQAADRVRSLRYGREDKDYFWLQDISPRMIMHPYRSDLDGTDLSGFTDPRGVAIFAEFAKVARERKEGYVGYVWQWKDDPTRLEAKESYIRLFEPWGWIIGTGVYLNDVRAEIAVLKKRLAYAMGGTALVLIALLLVMVRGGLDIEGRRREAEKKLRETSERYRSLVHAAAEGVLFIRNDLCSYANPVMLELIGCDERELRLLSLGEIFPTLAVGGPGDGDRYAPLPLRRRDGATVACLVKVRELASRPSDGLVVIARRAEDFSPPPQAGGVLQRLLRLPATLADDIARDIAQAGEEETVIARCRRSPELVRAMLAVAADPSAIVRAVTAITDAATLRFIELAQREIGEPPVPFAFIALGSQGRWEQTLFTDQDNAIVYDDAGADDPRAETYFITLAAAVCENLVRSGYRPCRGRIMANNPRWCRPLSVWKGYFSRWADRAEEQEMLDISTFLDLRRVAGALDCVGELRAHLDRRLDDRPPLFAHLAGQALSFKPPLRLFGSLILPGGDREQAGLLDLKAAMMPVVNYARLFALRHGIAATATPDRIIALQERGIIPASRAQDILAVFGALLRLRLANQSATVERGGEPDNLIDPSLLGRMDEAVLRESFVEIDHFQEQIKQTFLGGADRIG